MKHSILSVLAAVVLLASLPSLTPALLQRADQVIE
jgi:hypothetical protein